MLSGIGFQEWETSLAPNDNFFADNNLDHQNTFCPQYYGIAPYYQGDSRAWFAGSNGGICNWLLFPSFATNEPDIRATNGWGSQILVRNNNPNQASANIVTSNGNCLANNNISSQAIWTIIPCAAFSAARIESDSDISVVVP